MNKRKRLFILSKWTLILLMFLCGCKKKDGNNIIIPPTLPLLTTSTVAVLSQTTASGGGSITDEGGTKITIKGICWSTGQLPTIENSKTTDGTGKGNYESTLTGLAPMATYYVRAYATNTTGTGYGNSITYTTGENTITDIDDNIYYTITIGRQQWMMGNLRTTHYRDGKDIANVSDSLHWISLLTGAYCKNKTDSNSIQSYGLLYNFFAAGNHQKISPPGWHVPSDKEWITLVAYLDGDTIAGGKLKEAGTGHWNSPNTGATNESSFLGLPGGARAYKGAFLRIGYCSSFWSSSEFDSDNAWGWSLSQNNTFCSRSSNSKTYGFSIRCVKD